MAVGRRPCPPRHQAVELAAARRPRPPHRRGLCRGTAVPLAAGCRPGQHDACPRSAANAQRVYRRALRQFRPEEIAEAFAASRGVTIPSQSRAMLRRDRRDLLTGFRRLAPRRRPVRIQWWRIRRFIATGRLLLISALLVAWVYGNSLAVNPETFDSNARAVANVVDVGAPTCRPGVGATAPARTHGAGRSPGRRLALRARAFGPGRRSVQG